jgi:hypothetical protein
LSLVGFSGSTCRIDPTSNVKTQRIPAVALVSVDAGRLSPR